MTDEERRREEKIEAQNDRICGIVCNITVSVITTVLLNILLSAALG